jgi:hypothetical protein
MDSFFVILSRLSPHAAASDHEWTWGEAGEQALYGAISVFTILILLTVLTWAAGKIVPRFEKGRNADNGK